MCEGVSRLCNTVHCGSGTRNQMPADGRLEMNDVSERGCEEYIVSHTQYGLLWLTHVS